MLMRRERVVRTAVCIFVSLIITTSLLCAADVTVSDVDGLRRAARNAKPGDTILVEPGRYARGVWIEKVSGRRDAPITISGADTNDMPVFCGSGTGFQLSDCSYIVVRAVRVSGCSANGINASDGGTYDSPARGLVFEDIVVENIGPKGNHDALKLSGLDGFTVSSCTFRGWGGSAIDMVGCHNGTIDSCTFLGVEGFSQATGPQMKGGSSNISITRSFFRNAGDRGINIGGSTGLAYFRPEVGDYEASDIVIAGNRFTGSIAPIAWVTAAGGHVHHNTFVNPQKWVMRILQETDDPQFKPCHDGIFEDNLVVYDKDVRVFVNVGPNTAPGTFKFRRNAWYRLDGKKADVKLPVPEEDGIYGVDPKIENTNSAESSLTAKNPALAGIGADGYRRVPE